MAKLKLVPPVKVLQFIKFCKPLFAIANMQYICSWDTYEKFNSLGE